MFQKYSFQIFLFLFVIILRSSTFYFDFQSFDETEYAVAAMSLLNGGTPYIDFWIHHPPGMYWLYAVVFGVLGPWNMVAINLVFAVFVTLTALALGTLCVKLARGPFLGANVNSKDWEDSKSFRQQGVALIYVLVSHSFLAKDFLAANVEIVLNFLTVMSFLCLAMSGPISPIKGRIYRWGSFGLFVLGIFFKIQMVCFGAAWVWLYFWNIRSISKSRPWYLCEGFGLALVLGGSGLFGTWMVGGVGNAMEAYHAIWEHGVRYAKYPWVYFHETSGESYFQYLNLQILRSFLRWGVILGVALPLSVSWVWGKCYRLPLLESLGIHRKGLGGFLVLWFVGSFISVQLGGRLFWHYFLFLFPPLCLWVGYGSLPGLPRSRWGRVCVCIPCVAFFASHWMIQGYSQTNVSRSFVQVIEDHSRADESIWVGGFHPELYFYSQRRNGIRFLHSDILLGDSRLSKGLRSVKKFSYLDRLSTDISLKHHDLGVEPSVDFYQKVSSSMGSQDWQTWFQDLTQNRPRLLIFPPNRDLELYQEFSLQILQFDLKAYLESEYQEVGIVNSFVFYARTA